MTNARESLASVQVLLCRSNGRLCAFPLANVLETMRALPVEPVPAMPHCVLGVTIVRGVPAPVVDVGRLLGGGSGAAARRFVSLKLDGRILALALDEVVGVRTVAAADLAAVAPLLDNADSGVLQAIATLDAELLLVLQASHLLPEKLWQGLVIPEHVA